MWAISRSRPLRALVAARVDTRDKYGTNLLVNHVSLDGRWKPGPLTSGLAEPDTRRELAVRAWTRRWCSAGISRLWGTRVFCDDRDAPERPTRDVVEQRADVLMEQRGFAPLRELSSYYSLEHWDGDLRGTVLSHLKKDDSFFEELWEDAAARLVKLHARGEAEEARWRAEDLPAHVRELNGMNCVFIRDVFREFGVPIGKSASFWDDLTLGPKPLGPVPKLGMWRSLRDDELAKQDLSRRGLLHDSFVQEPVKKRTKPPSFIEKADLFRCYDSVKKKLIDTGKLGRVLEPRVRPVSSFCVRQGEERDLGSYRDAEGREHLLGLCPEKLRWVLDYRIVNQYIRTAEKIRLLGTETVIEILERMLTAENRTPPLPSRKQVRAAAARHLRSIGEGARAQKLIGALAAPLLEGRDTLGGSAYPCGTTTTRPRGQQTDSTPPPRNHPASPQDRAGDRERRRGDEERGHEEREVVMGKLDFAGWYWQFVCRTPGENIVDLFNPYTGEYEFYEARVLLFGSLVSVFWPVGMSEALMRLLWKLSVIAVIYVDDTVLPAFRGRAEKQRQLVLLVFQLCGIKMSDDKDESLMVQESLTVLGVAYRLARGPGGAQLFMEAPQARIAKTLRLLGDLKIEAARGKAPLKKVLSMYGTLQSLNIFRRARTGVARIDALKPWTDKRFLLSRRKSHKTVLVAALDDIEVLVKTLKPVLLGAASDKRTVISVTDASLEGAVRAPDVEKIPRLGGLARTVDGFRPAWAHLVPAKWRCFWADLAPTKRSHIGIWEALAVLVQLLVEPQIFESSYILFWIDNMADVFCLTRGSSNCVVVDSIVAVIIEHLDANGADFWARWFSSEKNVSDCATRLEKMKILEEIGIPVVEDSDPVVRAVNHAISLTRARIRRTLEGPRRAQEIWDADRARTDAGIRPGKKRGRTNGVAGAGAVELRDGTVRGGGSPGDTTGEAKPKRRRRGRRTGRRVEDETGGTRRVIPPVPGRPREGSVRVPEFLQGMAARRLCSIDSAIEALSDPMREGMVLGE